MEFANNGFNLGGGGEREKNSSTKNAKSGLLDHPCVHSGTAASSVAREDRLDLQS